MEAANELLWPIASSPKRARWAARAVERHLYMARIILTRAAAGPARQAAIPAQALDLARQLYEEIEQPVDCEHRQRGTTSLLARLQGERHS